MILDILSISVIVLCIVIISIMIWYCRKLISFMNSYNAVVVSLASSIKDFEEHLESVYNRETFYGDSTLQGLLAHARELNEELKIFVDENKDIFTIEETYEKEEI